MSSSGPDSQLPAKHGWSRFGMPAMGILFLVLIVLLLTHQIREHQAGLRETGSRNNLKQIGLALHNYHEAFHLLPPGSVVGKLAETHHGWQTSILPFLEATPFYSAIDFQRPWNDVRNAYVFRFPYPEYLNPSIAETSDESGFALSHYAGSSHVFSENKSSNFKDLPQGSSQTVMAGEIADDYPPWGQPGNWRDPALAPNSSSTSFGRPSRDGAQLLMADGSVRFVSNRVDQAIYQPPPRSAVEHPKFDMDIRTLHADLRIFLQVDQHGRIIMASGPWHDKMDYRSGTLQAKTEITDAEMKIFADMPEPEHLSVHGSQISDNGLKQLENLRKLQLLTISSAYITDAGLKHLEGLSSLKVLNIRSKHLTEAGIARLRKNLPQCEVSWSTPRSDQN